MATTTHKKPAKKKARRRVQVNWKEVKAWMIL